MTVAAAGPIMLCANANRRIAVLVHHGGAVSRLSAFVVTLGLLVATICTALADIRPPGHGSGIADVPGRGHRGLYTTGGDEGGRGIKGGRPGGVARAPRSQIAADVAAEGGAGYGVPGNRGSVFEALAARSVQPDDALVVFYGSRNDQGVDPARFFGAALCALNVARRLAPPQRSWSSGRHGRRPTCLPPSH
jgi:hypothetical protein